ncbi:nuclear transport factor 2 family protein [Lactiplantibacillus carotarum]|uniref:nuclear transport factor 2 family protein n=1 Tax=Lactiplantibacillus carotarum TaxID=2993456 RepID=UPI00298F0F81|nr:nuclear transport factor 2 family protein [Lactiplantibacillus carotarum]
MINKISAADRVVAVVRAQVQAMQTKDFTTLARVIAPDAQLIHITGKVQTRDQWFKEIARGRMEYFGHHEDGVQVSVSANRATVTLRNRLDARVYGFRNTWSLASTSTLEKRDGNWVIIRSSSQMY